MYNTQMKTPDEVADLSEDNPNEATHFSCCNACNAYSNDFLYLEDPKTTQYKENDKEFVNTITKKQQGQFTNQNLFKQFLFK